MTTATPAVLPARPHERLAWLLAGRDLVTMTRRSLLRMVRYPSLTVLIVAMPVVLLLVFVYVFGGAVGAGVVPGAVPGASGREAYLDYITPGILAMTGASIAQSTSISVAMDMSDGVVTRLRTMPVAPLAVLGGHVVAAVVQTLMAIAAVLGVAVLLGFRPDAGPAHWLLLLGFVALVALMLTWLSAAMGAAAPSVESASNTPMLLLLLPFLSSGFVPVETMPGPVRFFAEHQPFTPIIETLRGLLAGQAVDATTAGAAVAWCVGLGALGWLWARAAYRRPRV
ncbi:ABC transporter permease [Nocardioides sp. ChNu-153]|uniref:ABC transporter permease n=1 Tax=unclassified Nocardioides TaxID=2615069 RepID=UPI00240689B0|nr:MULTISPECIES: ABC transporter permease [unclassified Nocardioides]MDF9714674.1 ABC transporter permease [Nocardioides sp. ChNu-99]MDN7119793.1 ABC transporter permease [Nocardioides sp. ChNu-153]